MTRSFGVLHIVLFGLLVCNVTGQSVTTGSTSRHRLDVTVLEQPDCPIKLTFDAVWVSNDGRPVTKVGVSKDSIYSGQPRDLALKFENISSKSIVGYALVSKSHGFHNVQVNPLVKPLLPGKSLFRGFGTGGYEEISYHIDYVIFEDGSSWGEDKHARSKIIGSYLEAHKDAMRELKRLAASYPAPDEFVEQASSFGGFLHSDRVGPQDPDILSRQTRLAWTHVVTMLLRFERRLNEASEIAYKLESLIPDSSKH